MLVKSSYQSNITTYNNTTRMRKLFALLTASLITFAASAEPLKVFNHLGFTAGVGTNGISIEAATPITPYLQLRAGVSYMPSFTFKSGVETYAQVGGHEVEGWTRLEGDIGRVQGQVILNVYPFPKVPFYVAVGGYFGGNKAVKITGTVPSESIGNDGFINIGDYKLPVNPDGTVDGGIKVRNFRPYIGIGWGRAIPSKLINFSVDLGVQIHGTPKLYTNFGEITEMAEVDDNTFKKIIDKAVVYPTLTFRLGFRAL